MRARFGLALALTLLAAVPDKAAAAPVPAGAEWTQATFPSPDDRSDTIQGDPGTPRARAR